MNFQEFYNEYAKDVLKRKGYPLRAKYKANILFEFSREMIGENISSIADIGGCYGYCVAEFQTLYESKYSCEVNSTVYELGEDFINIGSTLFPNIRFLHSDKIGPENLYVRLIGGHLMILGQTFKNGNLRGGLDN